MFCLRSFHAWLGSKNLALNNIGHGPRASFACANLQGLFPARPDLSTPLALAGGRRNPPVLRRSSPQASLIMCTSAKSGIPKLENNSSRSTTFYFLIILPWWLCASDSSATDSFLLGSEGSFRLAWHGSPSSGTVKP